MSSNAVPLPGSSSEAATVLVGLFIPAANQEERALRARILVAQVRAARRRDRSVSPDAARLYALASSISSEWGFRQEARQVDLSDIIKVVTWLFLAAGALDRLGWSNVE